MAVVSSWYVFWIKTSKPEKQQHKFVQQLFNLKIGFDCSPFWYCFSLAILWTPIASLSTNKTGLRWRRTAGPSLSGAVWRRWASWCVRHWRTWSSYRAGISPPLARSAVYGPIKEVLTSETRLISHLITTPGYFFSKKFWIYLEKFINIFILFHQR